MVGVADRHDRDTGLLGFLDRKIHGLYGYQLSHAVMRVDDCGDRRLKDQFWLGADLDHAVFDAFMVTHQTLKAVRRDAVKIGKQQDIRDLRRLLIREAEADERIVQKALHFRIMITNRFCHELPPYAEKMIRINNRLREVLPVSRTCRPAR